MQCSDDDDGGGGGESASSEGAEEALVDAADSGDKVADAYEDGDAD